MTKEELLLFRRALGYKQGDLAEKLGVALRTVGNWERGASRIPDDLPSRLAALNKAPAFVPAELPYARWRPYPWANRDYTLTELDRCRPGTLVWRLTYADQPSMWVVRQAFKLGQFHHGLDITLPAEAFPDSNGAEAPWARAAFADLERAETVARAKRNALWREIGAAPEGEIGS